MNENTMKRDVESAYGSDVASTLIMNKEQFLIEEPPTKTEMCYQWVKYRIRHYMILEALFFIMLVLLLSNSYHISSQNEKTLEMISNVQFQINHLEKRLNLNQVFEKDNFEVQVEPISKENKELEEKEENEIIKPTEMAESIQNDERSQEKKTTPITENNSETVNLLSLEQEDDMMISTNSTQSVINAANIVIGASIDRYHSSTSVSPKDGFSMKVAYFFGRDQSEYVLLEREQLPLHKAWCSDEKQPILTVNLAKYIIPTAVSYQHTKWNGTVPNGAPKVYDLVACLDSICEKWEPLVSNCEYKVLDNTDYQQEQICQIPFNQNITSINKVQFRFHENYGNRNKTCAYLVRVYGEPRHPPDYEQQLEAKKQEEIQRQQRKLQTEAEFCSSKKWLYYNLPIVYNGVEKKDCTLLYSKKCCNECPECCQECEMNDYTLYNIMLFSLVVLISWAILFVIAAIMTGVLTICQRYCK